MKSFNLQVRGLIVPTLILALIILPFALFGATIEAFSLARANELVGAGLITLTIGLLAADVLLPVPSSIISLLASNALGVWVGASTIWVGMTMGCLVGTLVGKSVLSPINEYLKVPEAHAESSQIPRSNWYLFGLVLMRPVPVMAEASVLMAASQGRSTRDIMLVTGIANIPVAALYGYFGGVIEQDLPLVVSFGVLAVMTVVALIWRGIIRRKSVE